MSQHALAVPMVFDLADDWSDALNPNGSWTYTGNNGALLTSNQADWDPGSIMFGSPQQAWADAPFPNPTHVPAWFRRTSDATQLDIPLGGVGMHGSEGSLDAWVGVSWTSPGDGNANVSGGIWQALKVVNDGVGGNHQVRSSDWRITLNGVALTGGTLSGTDLFTSLAPFDLALADLAVVANDVITLEFISPRSFATFNGVDLTVSLDTVSVPEPAALALLAAGLLGLGMRRRRAAG